MLSNLLQELPRKRTLLYLLVLIVLTTLTYSNHFQNSFHFDDSHTVQNNLFIQDIKNIPLFFKDGTTFSSLPGNQSYRPVVSASLAIDYWLGNGYDLFYFHLSSFILFVLQGILMFFLIFKLFDLSYRNSWDFYIAIAASGWYLLHPANAETVNYVIARSDLQSTFFVVLAFVLYIFSPFSKRTFIYLLPIIIGSLAKPTAVMFAPIFFFYVSLFEQKIGLGALLQKENRSKLWLAIKTSIPAFIICAVMYVWVDKLTPATWDVGNISRWDYLITQPYVIFHYFTTFFFPFGLSADTDWELQHSILNAKFFIGTAFILFLLFLAWIFSKSEKLRPITFGIIWFLLALVPTSSIIPLSEVLNDHRIYFPYVGLVISVCWTIGLLLLKYQQRFLTSVPSFSKITAAAVLVLLLGYAYGVRERNKVWLTEESLWQDVTIKSPKNARGLMNYGLAKMSKGDYPEAEKYFTKALEMWPQYSFLHVNLGVLKSATGDPASAEMYFKNGIMYGPGMPDSWYYFGKFLCDQGRYPEAIPLLVKAIEVSAAHIGARSSLMRAYSETSNWEQLAAVAQGTLKIIPGNAEAIQYLEASKTQKGKVELMAEEIKKSPTAAKYLDLSLVYYQKGDYLSCIAACQEALKLNPFFAEAYNNMGSAYNLLKKYDDAIAACQKALELKPDFQLAKNNLAEALRNKDAILNAENVAKEKPSPETYLDLSLSYYQQGQYEKCIEACNNALKLKPDYADAYSNICASYNQLKQWDKAIEACNKALMIDPTHKLANGNLNWAKDEKK